MQVLHFRMTMKYTLKKKEEDLVLGPFGPSNRQITRGFPNDFSITSSGFPRQIIPISTNTDYTLPYHKKKKKKKPDSQLEASKVFPCVGNTSFLLVRGKSNQFFWYHIDQNN